MPLGGSETARSTHSHSHLLPSIPRQFRAYQQHQQVNASVHAPSLHVDIRNRVCLGLDTRTADELRALRFQLCQGSPHSTVVREAARCVAVHLAPPSTLHSGYDPSRPCSATADFPAVLLPSRDNRTTRRPYRRRLPLGQASSTRLRHVPRYAASAWRRCKWRSGARGLLRICGSSRRLRMWAVGCRR